VMPSLRTQTRSSCLNRYSILTSSQLGLSQPRIDVEGKQFKPTPVRLGLMPEDNRNQPIKVFPNAFNVNRNVIQPPLSETVFFTPTKEVYNSEDPLIQLSAT
jgi:hypothetical protein